MPAAKADVETTVTSKTDKRTETLGIVFLRVIDAAPPTRMHKLLGGG